MTSGLFVLIGYIYVFVCVCVCTYVDIYVLYTDMHSIYLL